MDPRTLAAPQRRSWMERARAEPPSWPRSNRWESRYWLLEAGRTVGTIALGRPFLGSAWVRVSSLYVVPQARGRGTARRSLAEVQRALGGHWRGIRLETGWTWQKSLRFYLRAGFWVRMWKRDIELYAGLGVPAPRVELGTRAATLWVDVEGERIALATAERDGDKLVSFVAKSLDQLDAGAVPPEAHEGLSVIARDADSTLAVLLAMKLPEPS